MQKNNKGFSLIELLISITVMTIIAAAITPINIPIKDINAIAGPIMFTP